MRDLGFVFQEPTLMPWATAVRQRHAAAHAWPASRKRGAPRRARAATLAMVGLAGLRERLSARAVGRHEDARVDRPRAGDAAALLLMDEPFAALDEITRYKLNDDLLELWQRQGFTVALRHPFGVRDRSFSRNASW